VPTILVPDVLILFSWIGADFDIRIGGQKTEQLMLAFDRIFFVPRAPVHVVQMPAKNASGRLSSRANQLGIFLGFVSAYSQNDVKGTTQRF
jgi:hypothetical protein